MNPILTTTCLLASLMCSSALHGQIIAPTPTPSTLKVQVDLVGVMPKVPGANLASPQAYGPNELFLISQNPPNVFSVDQKTGQITEIYNSSLTPSGIAPTGSFSLMNVAGNHAKNKVYMVFTSLTLPPNIPVRTLPDPDTDPSGGREDFLFIDTFAPALGFGNGNAGSGPLLNRDIYNIDAPQYTLFFRNIPVLAAYQVFVEFDYAGGVLSNPKPFLALETQEGPFHSGGGMLVMPDGRIAYTTGDNLPFGMEGRRAPQDDNSHLSKLLIVDPATGGVQVAAKGLRNVQHIQLTTQPAGIAFADIGGVTAEEVNFISWRDLLDTSTIENFGWGRNADGLAREGTYYVDQGVPFKLGTQPAAVGMAPVPEIGFRQPLAQYGRNALSPFTFVAISGPAVSNKSFKEISVLCGDLPTGEVYATTAKIDGLNATMFRVNLVDANGSPLGPNNSLNDLANGRSDGRIFVFPDGRAGVLLEANGAFFVLTEK